MTTPKDPPEFTAALELIQARLKALESAPFQRLAYSRQEFCQIHDISLSTFHKLQKEGRGPALMHVGAQPRISVEAAADWRRMMEKHMASEAAQLHRARRERAASMAGKIAGESPLHVSKKKKRG